MKERRLLYAIGWVEDQYIKEMEEPVAHNRSKRIWLLAAVIAALLILAGCAAVLLRLQEVGRYQSFYVPTVYDENGEIIPTEYQEPLVYYAVPGANQKAAAEWLAFVKTYDLEGQALLEADRTQRDGTWNIPESYDSIYGCYSQEMVDKLQEIARKYHLKLLETEIDNMEYEGADGYLDILGIDHLVKPDSGAEVENNFIWFSLDGALVETHFEISLEEEHLAMKKSNILYIYAKREYFYPQIEAFPECERLQQWEYIRQDGKQVLLVQSESSARIYAATRDAYITISIDSAYQTDGKAVPMTRTALEELAEIFDLSIHPKATTMDKVQKVQAQALSEYQARKEREAAERALEHAAWETHYNSLDYQEFVNARIKKEYRPESVSFLLRDLNGGGGEELIIPGREILSMKDGKTFRYFDFASQTDNPLLACRFIPCENQVFELSAILWKQYNFYQAGAEAPIFLTGVFFDEATNTWYRSLNGGYAEADRIAIAPEEAQEIRNAYTEVEVEFLPLTRYGDPQMPPKYDEPYAQYIANQMYRYSEAKDFRYALLDIDGNGVQELITVEPHSWESEHSDRLLIQTIQDGKSRYISALNSEDNINTEWYSYVCEGGILEARDEEGTVYAYFRLTPEEVVQIEKVVQDPITLYWGYVPNGGEGRTVHKEYAMSVIDSYKHIDLVFHLFAEYPFP